MPNISIIVAISENYAIGRNNQLLWHIPDDLKRFKEITSGHTIIMGKNTFLSLPNGALPNRRNIVITDDINDKLENCEMAFSIVEAISKCDKEKENFIIGGGMIYKQFFNYANKLYITLIHEKIIADIYFPQIDFKNWVEIYSEKKKQDKPQKLEFTYQIYIKK